jgi:hypothetical protein
MTLTRRHDFCDVENPENILHQKIKLWSGRTFRSGTRKTCTKNKWSKPKNYSIH